MTFDGDGWQLTLDSLRPLLDRPVRALIVNSPHNPTGWQMPAALQAELVALTAANGTLLFSDEVYRGLEHHPAERLPAACDLSDRALSLGVMSKSYGLAGLRIGWVATRDRSLLEAMAAHKDYTSICSSAPSETLARLALRHGERLVEQSQGVIESNRKRLQSFLDRHPGLFRGAFPQAGPIAFPRVDPARLGGKTTLEWCERLASEAGVLLLPGELFESRWTGHVRLGFGRVGFPEALDRLGRWLA
jgi:aspartate/methionine/tyrosine aminotransferase